MWSMGSEIIGGNLEVGISHRLSRMDGSIARGKWVALVAWKMDGGWMPISMLEPLNLSQLVINKDI